MALLSAAIGAGITVASAAVAKLKTNATLKLIMLVCMLTFSCLFSLQTCSIRQLSRKCADRGQVFNQSCHTQRVATLFYKISNVAVVRPVAALPVASGSYTRCDLS
jgi:hypothetical protein